MKTKVLCFIFLLAAVNMQVFAKGKADKNETEILTQNDEWFLCITNFDVSSLYAEKTNISGIVIKNMIERFEKINFRTRISPEYAYYEDRAWAQSRSSAAKALSSKMDERSSKIYLGEPKWKYKREIAKLETQIEELRLKLDEVESTAPLINKEPMFKLKQNITDTSFPSSPKAGDEVKFCRDQKIDAFISGSITDFHGRYLLSIKLYTLYTRSFVWEESVIFSHDDLSSTLEELLLRMTIVLSGNKPSAVAVVSEPEDTLVLINKSFVGKGDTSVKEFPAGTVIVTASALNHDSITFETELSPGELSILNIRLNPVEYGELEISGNSGSNVYHGALYAGEAPLTLRLPINKIEYIEVENPSKKGSVVFQTPENPDFNNSITVRLKVPPKKGHVDRARSHYYWTWGGTWITGIAAWISYYTYMNITSAINSDSLNNKTYSQELYNDYNTSRIVLNSTLAAFGAVTVYGLYRLIRYINTSGKGSVPAIATGRKKNENRR